MASKSKLSRLLTEGEAGVADAPLDSARLAVEQLQLDQPRQIPHVVDVLGGALPGELFVLAQHGRQLQLLEMMAQKDLGRLGDGCAGHAGAPASALGSRLM
jgi:hypothetical protein